MVVTIALLILGETFFPSCVVGVRTKCRKDFLLDQALNKEQIYKKKQNTKYISRQNYVIALNVNQQDLTKLQKFNNEDHISPKRQNQLKAFLIQTVVIHCT